MNPETIRMLIELLLIPAILGAAKFAQNMIKTMVDTIAKERQTMMEAIAAERRNASSSQEAFITFLKEETAAQAKERERLLETLAQHVEASRTISKQNDEILYRVRLLTNGVGGSGDHHHTGIRLEGKG